MVNEHFEAIFNDDGLSAEVLQHFLNLRLRWMGGSGPCSSGVMAYRLMGYGVAFSHPTVLPRYSASSAANNVFIVGRFILKTKTDFAAEDAE